MARTPPNARRSPHRVRVLAATALVSLAALSPAGCTAAGRRDADGIDSAIEWPFGPRSLRIHPLTRIVPGDAPQSFALESYLELRDADGHDTRGVGRLDLTLAAVAGGEGLPELRWPVDLGDPVANRRYFDGISRTYRVPLRIDWPAAAAPRTVRLRAELVLPGGEVLRDDRVVEWPKAAPDRT